MRKSVFATASTVFATVLRGLNELPYWIFFFRSTLSLKKYFTFLAVAFTKFLHHVKHLQYAVNPAHLQ